MAARQATKRLRGRTVVITGGPTREHLDDIRFLSNASTGRMGHELAVAAARAGAAVTLVQGPTALPDPRGVRVVSIVSTADLLRATRAAVPDADAVVFSAAPSDWRPARRRRGKPARADGPFPLELVPTPDVAEAVGRRKGDRVHVGFALEVRGGVARARRKLARKHLDAIVLNGPENFGDGGGGVAWITARGPAEPLPAGKPALARAIVVRLARLLDASG